MEGAVRFGGDCLSREPCVARPFRATVGNIPIVRRFPRGLLRKHAKQMHYRTIGV